MTTFRVCSLASGSSGNAYYAEHGGAALLVDLGISGKRLLENLRAVGGRPERVAAVLLTHDHSDHVTGAGICHRRHGWPLFMTEGTWRGTRDRLGRLAVPPRLFRAGARFDLAGFTVECHATPHDADEPVALVLEHGGRRVGVLTDLGHPFAGLGELIGTLDGVFLESNYNRELLRINRLYPAALKRRIVSSAGHLENAEAGELLLRHATPRLRTVVLSHLSEQNNRPEVALADVSGVCGARLAELGARLAVAPRHVPGGWMTL